MIEAPVYFVWGFTTAVAVLGLVHYLFKEVFK